MVVCMTESLLALLFFICISIFGTLFYVHALKSGVLYSKFGVVRRETHPAYFKFVAVTLGVIVILFDVSVLIILLTILLGVDITKI